MPIEQATIQDLPTAHLLGFPIHLVDGQAAQLAVQHALEQGETWHVVTLNPEMIMQGQQHEELGDILKQAELILPDGAGVVWALRRLGKRIQRVPGIEFSERLLQWAAEQTIPVALVGASPEVLQTASEALTRRYAGLSLVYTHHGFFQPGEEEQQVVTACAQARPQVVLVALGVPRQEQWIARWRHQFPRAVLVGVGGSLDVWSGKTRRAPAWMRWLNLEWLYRITSEPWRIRRIYKTLPMFVVKICMSGKHPG